MAKTPNQNPGGQKSRQPSKGLTGGAANKLTNVARNEGWNSTQEGTEQGVWGAAKGQNGPGMDAYPPEYARLVGSFSNGTDSIGHPMGPVKPMDSTQSSIPAGWTIAQTKKWAQDYLKGHDSQPFRKGAGSADGKEGK